METHKFWHVIFAVGFLLVVVAAIQGIPFVRLSGSIRVFVGVAGIILMFVGAVLSPDPSIIDNLREVLH